MKIVWVSRHELDERNHRILQEAFKDYEIVQYKETVKDVKELVDFADKHNADAYVVVLPPHLIQQLLKDKRPVYRFIVEREVDEIGNVKFTPIGLERIVKIQIITERVV